MNLTNDEIDKLHGRELDVLVDTLVMGNEPNAICEGGEFLEQGYSSDGWYCSKCGYKGYWGDTYNHRRLVPSYGTNEADAMAVFLSFENTYKLICNEPRMSNGWTIGQPFVWSCRIRATNFAQADTLCVAVCHAALKAKRNE